MGKGVDGPEEGKWSGTQSNFNGYSTVGLPGEKPIAMVNPVVSEKSDFKRASEGCLSVPGESAEVERAHKCLVKYQDVEGISWVTECFGLYAVAVQHEVDHLDGVVYVERLPRSKREPIRKRMLAMKKHSMVGARA